MEHPCWLAQLVSPSREGAWAARPLDWAAFLNNLGNALARLGQLESSTNRIEKAIAAYCAAQEEFVPEREPLQWSKTQNNLANALRMLGVLSNDERFLIQPGKAIEAFSGAPFSGITQDGEFVFGPMEGELKQSGDDCFEAD